jgi:hypothetical protein
MCGPFKCAEGRHQFHKRNQFVFAFMVSDRLSLKAKAAKFGVPASAVR